MFSTLVASFSLIGALLPFVKSSTVSTIYGDIEGIVESYPAYSNTSFQSFPFKSVTKFLGVPFAAPPIGELRFKAPEPPKSWKPKVLQAKTHGNECSGSEDCLFLDVYTPNVSLSLPVLFYIHGGAYSSGSAVQYPSDILALQGVVVVVIQYRLGPFGFLTTGDSAAPGNFGMLDQVEALKWVKENIDHFGGDPSKVTIFGESAGATSVSLHLLSPLSEALFHQAIAESGVDLSSFAIQPTTLGIRIAKDLAQNLDCATSEHNAMIACIREKKAAEIQRASQKVEYVFADVLMWAPVVDKIFLLDTPRNLREKGEFKKVKFMISFNSHEGASYVGTIARLTFGMTESVENGVNPSYFNEFVTGYAYMFARNSKNHTADLMADALKFMYTPWPDKSNKYALRSQLVDFIGDSVFVAPSHEVADIHSQHAPVYMYEFAHRSKNASYDPEWMGVAHGEDVPYHFGIPLLPRLTIYDEVDKNVSLFVMAVYANFARTGDPTPQPVSGITWERYNTSHRAYLRVDASPRMSAAFATRRMAFWNEYIPKLKQVKFVTKDVVTSGASASVAMDIFHQVALVITLELFY